jgi:hypothetical protein
MQPLEKLFAVHLTVNRVETQVDAPWLGDRFYTATSEALDGLVNTAIK